jgi:amino acid adenylation domain-containing protein
MELIPQRFQRIAATYPDSIAVEGKSGTLTYAELNAASNRLARLLGSSGVGQNIIVGSLLSADIQLPVSMLGIFKSRGIYLPLDANFSPARLEQIFSQTFHGYLVCTSEDISLAKSIASRYADPIKDLYIIEMCSDANFVVWRRTRTKWSLEKPSKISETNPDVRLNESDNNYIYYTSGSTGEGKAIIGRNNSLSHYIDWAITEFKVDNHQVIGHLSQPTFDASLKDTLVPLCSGGTLSFPHANFREGVEHIIRWLIERKINLFQVVPSVFRLVIGHLKDSQSIGEFKDLRHIILDGEPLYARDVFEARRWLGNHVELINQYGCTESTILDTIHRIKEISDDLSEMIHVGKPIDKKFVLILDDLGGLCRIGQVGEIYIKSPFLTDGYVNDSELNSRLFVQNPLVRDCRDIIYRTGDLGKYLVDRNILVIGRNDKQVKINGIRIDLNEIEKAFLKVDEVQQVSLTIHTNSTHQKTLIAYYVGSLEANELRRKLEEHLNKNMLPGIFVKLDSLPVNINGKLDKKQLPVPEQLLVQSNTRSLDSVEVALQRIWKEVLLFDNVDIHTSFFIIGGDSLRAIKLVSRIRQELKVAVNISDIFANNSIAEQALLIKSLRETNYDVILRCPSQPFYPVSHAQKRIWILQQFEKGLKAYDLDYGVFVTGKINKSNLKRSFESVLERHEILRTVVVEVDGEPMQRVIPFSEFDFEIKWIANTASEIQTILEREKEQSFNLEKGPLLRATVIEYGDEKYIFYFCIHHIIADGWSLETLLKEWIHFYNNGNNQLGNYKPLAIQFKDYVYWFNKQQTDESFQKHRNYWKSKFETLSPSQDVFTNYARPTFKKYAGAKQNFVLSEELSRAFIQYTQSRNTTLFITVLTCIKALFYRYTQQNDITIGSPVAGRNHIDLENQIGFYANTVGLRTTFEHKTSFVDLLSAVQTTVLEAFENQDYPIEQLISELTIERDPSRSPLFDVMVVWQNFDTIPMLSSLLPEVRISPYPLPHKTSKFDLTFTFFSRDNRLHFEVEYDTSLYTNERIIVLVEHFTFLSGKMLDDPKQPLLIHDFLTEREHQQITSFNNTFCEFPEHDSLVSLFEEQAALRPDQIAVEFKNEKFTYREVNERANQIAYLLKTNYHISEGSCIGLMLRPSEWFVVIKMAILKTGASYLPIDPGYPKERINFMLRDSQAKLIIAEHMQGPFFSPAVELNALVEEKEHFASTNLNADVSPDGIAYVIYTSGSTGDPKGAMLRHRGVVNRIHWMWNEYGFSDTDSVLQKTPNTFDVSVCEIFMPLCFGCRLILCERETIYNPEMVMSLVNHHRVTTVCFVPSMYHAFLHFLEDTHLKSLVSMKRVVVSGEALKPETADLHYSKFNFPLHNLYGPTEASIDVSAYTVNRGDSCIPIGKPIQNMRLYVVDSEGINCPIGVDGEIVLAGVGLAQGYLNRPELTLEKFHAAPHLSEACIYRTGDVGRLSFDGVIEFQGRRDHQIKLRGVRIELQEIESALLKHFAVRDAVVLAKRFEDGTDYLCSYFLSDINIEPGDLKRYLKELLPEAMIPTFMLKLHDFPRTSSGKIDRQTLKNLEVVSASDNKDVLVPITKIESSLLAIWQEILGNESIDVNDNFFQIGGNSIRVISMKKKMDIEFPGLVDIHEIFNFPTIRKMGKLIEERVEPVLPRKVINKVEF